MARRYVSGESGALAELWRSGNIAGVCGISSDLPLSLIPPHLLADVRSSSGLSEGRRSDRAGGRRAVRSGGRKVLCQDAGRVTIASWAELPC